MLAVHVPKLPIIGFGTSEIQAGSANQVSEVWEIDVYFDIFGML